MRNMRKYLSKYIWRVLNINFVQCVVEEWLVALLGVVLPAEDLVVPDEAGILVGQQQVTHRAPAVQGRPIHNHVLGNFLKRQFCERW